MQVLIAHTSKRPPFIAAKLRAPTRLRNCPGHLLRQAAYDCAGAARAYTTSSVRSKRFPCYDTSIREYRDVRDASLKRAVLVHAQRRKSDRAKKQKRKEAEPEAPLLGGDPPLYDKNPGIFGRWAYFLLVLDVLFTGLSVDMVMRNWTQLVRPETETEAPPSDSSTSTTPAPSSPSTLNSDARYVLRPLWQRLALSGFEISVGIAAGALILASRDRTIWRLRVHRIPISSLPPRRPGMRPPPTTSPSSQMINVLVIETASGRKKRFLMQDCVLAPGRDLTEFMVTVKEIHTNFALSLNRARVLGHTLADVQDSAVLKELAKSKTVEDGMSVVNTGPGAEDPDNVDICDLRKVLAHGWVRAGGYLKVPRVPLATGSWTSGPVTGQ